MQASDEKSIEDVAPRSVARPALSFLQIWNMCCGLFGVQIVWGLQNVNTSRIFQTLGANIDELAILWIAAPITGLVLQPIVGYLSDRTWGPLGRRRPYLFFGSMLTAVALFIMPNVTTLWSASLMLWVLTASINVVMEPFRALVADTLPEKQRTTGFAMQVFFIGTGAVLASALPWVLTHWFGMSGLAAPGMLPQSVRMAFYVGGISLLVAVMWTVFTTSERPPEKLAADAPELAVHNVPTAKGAVALMRSGLLWIAGGGAICAVAAMQGYEREIYVLAAIACAFGFSQLAAVWLRRQGRMSIGMLEIVEDILHMPVVLGRLAIVQFFTWFGMFAMWIFTVPALAARHYGTTDATSAAYNASADWVGILFAGYNGVAALVALALPAISARIGQRACHALCLVLGAMGLLGFVTIDDPALLWIPDIGIGCAWASILSLPYAMLANALPPRKMGVYMGIHNIFLVLPQLVAATVLGFLLKHVFGGQAILALALSAGSLLLAAICVLAIPGQPRSDRPAGH
ncbi:MAG: major facilitator superfamily protein [Sphingomonas bacterium]|uniref:MFS transporter n=1 Tax=Sphingomonas bacterium TaxID=1895847 RepID=UPI00262F2CF5|nr:MFS transporter [Sphingomonas bacterium]MDB5705314.1 major facilitator superfamily protein [Sphingomonas bacterium]